MLQTSASSLPSGVIHSEKAARALIAAVASDELSVFRQGPLSAGELANQMGLAVYRALRLIQKWQHLGILEVKDVTRRAGRPIRRYGLSAPHFFIPALLLPYEEVLALVSQPMEQQMRRELGHVLVDLVGLQGTQVFLEPQRYGAYLVKQPGELWDGEAPGSPALTERWLTLRLDYSEACALRDELDELLTRYAQRQGSQVYQLHQRLVPFRSS